MFKMSNSNQIVTNNRNKCIVRSAGTSPAGVVKLLLQLSQNLNSEKRFAIQKSHSRCDSINNNIRGLQAKHLSLSNFLAGQRLKLCRTRAGNVRSLSLQEIVASENFENAARALPAIAERWRLMSKIAEGRSSHIFQVIDFSTGDIAVVKIQKNATENLSLENEHLVYSKLKSNSRFLRRAAYYPNIYHVGRYEYHNVMIMDRLGPSLDCVSQLHPEGMLLRDIANVGMQVIQCLRDLHSLDIVHCDVTPSNIVAASPACREWTLIDFGSSCSFQFPELGKHVPHIHGCDFRGSQWYKSANAHMGYIPCRRDDLESLAFVLIHLIEGTLPWLYLNASNSEHTMLWVEMKSTLLESNLMQNAPRQLYKFVEIIWNLEPTSTPPYTNLIGLLQEMKYAHDGGVQLVNELAEVMDEDLSI